MNAPVATSSLAADLEWRLATLVLQTLRGSFSGLSRTATGTLAHLRDHGPCRITELAASQAVAQPTMTTLVGRLERDGLVARAADAQDARAVLVQITGDGFALLDRAREVRARALAERTDALSARDRQALERVLPVLDRLIAEED